MQFTPDLMPSDVTGSLDLRRADGASSSSAQGPVFTNLLLADEINRTRRRRRPRCWRRWRSGRSRSTATPRPLPDPFFVVATQNPIEYEGTYPLPEAQLDRFLFKLTVPLPPRDEEIAVLDRHAHGFDPRDLAAPVRAGRLRRRPGRGPGRGGAGARRRPRCSATSSTCARATRQRPSLQLGVSPAWRDRAAGRRPGLGLAVRPRLRHARRREGAGPARPAAPGRSCAPRPSWRA